MKWITIDTTNGQKKQRRNKMPWVLSCFRILQDLTCMQDHVKQIGVQTAFAVLPLLLSHLTHTLTSISVKWFAFRITKLVSKPLCFLSPSSVREGYVKRHISLLFLFTSKIFILDAGEDKERECECERERERGGGKEQRLTYTSTFFFSLAWAICQLQSVEQHYKREHAKKRCSKFRGTTTSSLATTERVHVTQPLFCSCLLLFFLCSFPLL